MLYDDESPKVWILMCHGTPMMAYRGDPYPLVEFFVGDSLTFFEDATEHLDRKAIEAFGVWVLSNRWVSDKPEHAIKHHFFT